MTIISTTLLTNELPSDADATAVTNAVAESSVLVNTWAVNYEGFPDISGSTIMAPREVARACLEIAKALYWTGVGQVYRDGNESESWQALLDYYETYLGKIDIEPTGSSKTISLDSNGVQLIARGQHILRYHPKNRVESAASPSSIIWNQGTHWDIRKGSDPDAEFLDGWYFDAATYDETIEGTLYYYRSWRNDSKDYLRFGHESRSMD